VGRKQEGLGNQDKLHHLTLLKILLNFAPDVAPQVQYSRLYYTAAAKEFNVPLDRILRARELLID
jgi:hypothetical protein